MTWILAAAATLAELCRAAPAPAPAGAGPADAAAYAAVGDEARAGGEATIAVAAYRKALVLDPANRAAAAALAELCRGAAVAEDDAILLAAIALYRRGELDAARAALAAIARGGGPAAGGAHLFLGLIALEAHDRAAADRELAAARDDPAYAELTAGLVRLARRDGALAAVVLAAPEVDTNPRQLPDTPPVSSTAGAREADASLLVAGALTARPLSWLTLRDALAWRKQRSLTELDFLGENAQATAELARGPSRAALRYELDYDRVGGAPYLLAHQGALRLRRDLGRIELYGGAAVRRRDFRQAAQAVFTGWVYAADAGARVELGPRLDLDARLTGARELTADPIFAAAGGGAQLGVRARPAGRVRLTAQLAATFMRYDAPEPDGVLRRDLRAEATAGLEVDLGDYVIAVAGASAARNGSTVEDVRYWKLAAHCGLALAIGGP